MNSEQVAVILKSFDVPDEVHVMQKGKFELVDLRWNHNWSTKLESCARK
jgi:hypothetical protein